MKLFEVINKKYIKPITKYDKCLDGWEKISIKENSEKLVSLKGLMK